MSQWLRTGFIWLLLVPFVGQSSNAAELTSALDLVTNDVAFCLEVPQLQENWDRLESGPVMARLRAFPPFQRLLESPGFRHWQLVEEHVAHHTGSRLSSQLRAVFAKSLVLAIYVPPTGEPRGILFGEAKDAAAIQTAMATWTRLEPRGVVTNKRHHGQLYYQRKRETNAKESAFIAIHDRWFAISDHELMIHDVIDRFVSLTTANSSPMPVSSLSQSQAYLHNRLQRLPLRGDGIAFVHINARPWDRGLEESAQGSNDPIQLAEIWKHVTSVNACLRVQQGIVCEAIVEIDPARLSPEWPQLVATAAEKSTWIPRIPADALLAVAGRLEIAPLIRFLLDQMPAHDKAELTKIRRIAQSLFGGDDVLQSIVPKLARDFGGFVTTRRDETRNQVTLDGAIGFTWNDSSIDPIDGGLNSVFSALAAYLSVSGRDIVTVERRLSNGLLTRSLSDTTPFPVAFGISPGLPNNLVIAGSQKRLLQTLRADKEPTTQSRFSDHSQQFFDGMNQLIWLDTARVSDVMQQNGADLARLFAPDSTDEATRISKRFEQIRPYLGLIDSLFIAARIESDHLHLVFGGALDSQVVSQRN